MILQLLFDGPAKQRKNAQTYYFMVVTPAPSTALGARDNRENGLRGSTPGRRTTLSRQ